MLSKNMELNSGMNYVYKRHIHMIIILKDLVPKN